MSPGRELAPGRPGLASRSRLGAEGVPLGLGRHARKLARSIYSGSVTSMLREAIIGGQLSEGEPLVERTLADRLRVSRGPVRNAFHVLEGEGLVTTLANGRMVVAGFGLDDLADLLAVRFELESTAVRWAIDRRAEPQPVLDVLDEMAAEGTSTQRLVDLDIDFHRAMLELSGSRFLVQSWLAIAPVIHTVITLGNRELEGRDPVTNFERIISSHRTIVESLTAGNAIATVEKLAEQFRLTGSMFDHVDTAEVDSSRKG